MISLLFNPTMVWNNPSLLRVHYVGTDRVSKRQNFQFWWVISSTLITTVVIHQHCRYPEISAIPIRTQGQGRPVRVCFYPFECFGYIIWGYFQPSETHSYSPRVRGQHLVLLPHNAGVCALIDGICNNSNVVVLQGSVARVRRFQKLAILIPTTHKMMVNVRMLKSSSNPFENTHYHSKVESHM